MPKILMRCAGCGKEFYDYPSQHTGKKIFCTNACHLGNGARLTSGTGSQYVRQAWRAFNRMPMELDTISVPGRGAVRVNHATCYLKEARAILEGKNTKEKNKCVKLEGD
jgi:hypothetical protein